MIVDGKIIIGFLPNFDLSAQAQVTMERRYLLGASGERGEEAAKTLQMTVVKGFSLCVTVVY